MLVPMFFMLSGFLVAGSGMRLDLRNFVLNRGVRIVPALAVDIVWSALLLGPLLTTLPLSDYFGSPVFFEYFLNILGWPHYRLPGVFEQNPWIDVNYSLWTVPYEIGCYVIFSGIIFFGLVRSSSKVALCTALLLLTAVIVQASRVIHVLGIQNFPAQLLHFLFIDRGARLWPAFLIGILYYQLRDRIPYDRRIFITCIALCVASAALGNNALLSNNTLFHIVMLPVLGYITVFIGLTPIGVPSIFRRGDYSYGLYLYHMPFLQALIWLFPGIWGAGANLWWTLFFAAAPVSLLAAMFSWHFVEKPTLRLRRKFSFTAARPESGATQLVPQLATPDLGVLAMRGRTNAT